MEGFGGPGTGPKLSKPGGLDGSGSWGRVPLDWAGGDGERFR